MGKKLMGFKTKGMNKDLSVSAFNPEFAFENMNLRLSTNEGNTMMSWVNERGTWLITAIINTKPWYKGEDRLWTEEDLTEVTREKALEEIQQITEKLQWIQSYQESPNYESILQLWELQEGHTLQWFTDRLTLIEDEEFPITWALESGLIGTDRYFSTDLKGTPIGTATINHKLIIFTIETFSTFNSSTNQYEDTHIDRIYSFSKLDQGEFTNGININNIILTDFDLLGTLLYESTTDKNLNFSIEHPLETLVSYESEEVQKVYWVDGINQPRVINVVADITSEDMYNETSFDFVNELQLQEKITVKKTVGNNGVFPAGVIQYAFTYYKKHGQESNIFYTTPLLYISPRDRGAAPDEKVDNTFSISISNIDYNFDCIRIYSIIRTSIDATPLCKRVLDITLQRPSTTSYTAITTNADTYGYSNDSGSAFLSVRVRIDGNWLSLEEAEGTYVSIAHLEALNDMPNHLLDTYTEGYRFKADDYADFLVKLSPNTLWTDTKYITFDDGEYIYILKKLGVNCIEYCIFSTKEDTNDPGVYIATSYLLSNIEAQSKLLTFIDTGSIGDSIDPTELLYKGGESIIAKTLELKDNTLFLGNISVARQKVLDNFDKSLAACSSAYRYFYPLQITRGTNSYTYSNQLNSVEGKRNSWGRTSKMLNISVPCAGFKRGNTYRCGLQFLYKTGKWSDPVFIEDFTIPNSAVPLEDEDGYIKMPAIQCTIDDTQIKNLADSGYKRVRPVVVFPTLQDRNIICLGVLNPTLYTNKQRTIDKSLYALSSWFFRFTVSSDSVNASLDAGNAISPVYSGTLPYTERNVTTDTPDSNTDAYDPIDIRLVEVQGWYDTNNRFNIDRRIATLHTPDLEFDAELINTDISNSSIQKVGYTSIFSTYSDINIQTETPPISSAGAGFINKTFLTSVRDTLSYNDTTVLMSGTEGIVSGPFYDDFMVDDRDNRLEALCKLRSSMKWLVYLWNDSGSLNNDINRAADKGVASAVLKKKIISNLRFCAKYDGADWTTSIKWKDSPVSLNLDSTKKPGWYYSNEDTIIKLGDAIYKGNIDTLISADKGEGMYFVFDGENLETQVTTNNNVTTVSTFASEGSTSFTSKNWWKTFSLNDTSSYRFGSYKWNMLHNDDTHTSSWTVVGGYEGESFNGLNILKSSVRMKYKSTPHGVIAFSSTLQDSDINDIWQEKETNNNVISDVYGTLPVVELTHTSLNQFGGTSEDALKENIWIPCGEPVLFNKTGEDTYSDATVYYDYGDTYFLRWDCLKTYAFTPEDINQVIEIGSFMLETYVNIDGRYDKNRNLVSNLYMSPLNFNLMNPVYSQLNNFFSYKIGGSYEGDYNRYPNLITWTKTKESNADIDLWTNITLASILELDGDKGEITKLIRLNDLILAFLDKGISQILYNENVQVSTENSAPIELINSGKVQGKRYLSDTVGCTNKHSIVSTPNGIYFIDSYDKSIYLFNGELTNISLNGGMDSWCKQKIFLNKDGWNITKFNNISSTINDFVSYYDKKNRDVLFINKEEALAYSEKFNTFTSFYSYGGAPYLCTLDDLEIWINKSKATPSNEYYLWQHQSSKADYTNFFDAPKQYWTILVGNQEPLVDKTFTNLEFRACVEGEGTTKQDDSFDKFYLPFDNIEVWNEYQHGISALRLKDGTAKGKHGLQDSSKTSSLNRKFRIWRCDIPRDNYPAPILISDKEKELAKGITRFKARPMDRMRNPWIYIKLLKNEGTATVPLNKTEIHDTVLTYFD